MKFGLSELTQDFLTILDKCPSKLKKKILTWKVSENVSFVTSIYADIKKENEFTVFLKISHKMNF